MPVNVSILSPLPGSRLGEVLAKQLRTGDWEELRAAVAYVKMSGVKHLGQALFDFSQSARVRLTVGIDQQGSSLEGVQTLWQILDQHDGELYVLNNPGSGVSATFHPKVWLFSNSTRALLIVGSGNLTSGGLFSNYEVGTAVDLDLSDAGDRTAYDDVVALMESWTDCTLDEVVALDARTLALLHASGELPSESAINAASVIARTARSVLSGLARGARVASGVFGGRKVHAAPIAAGMPILPPPPVTALPTRRPMGSTPHPRPPKPGDRSTSIAPVNRVLYLEVNPRKKTEIYLAKRFLLEDPAFFGWPFYGLTTPKKTGNAPQPQPDPLPTATVKVYGVDGSVLAETLDPSLKIWTYSMGGSANDDFRLTLKDGLQKHVPDGSIMVMRRAVTYHFDIHFYPPLHFEFDALQAKCTSKLPGGRSFGWS